MRIIWRRRTDRNSPVTASHGTRLITTSSAQTNEVSSA